MSTTLGERFGRALATAAELHRGQVRKGSGVPYIAHLLSVCALVIDEGGGEDEAIAALLHDSAEDQGGQATLDRIRVEFGDVVADIVLACSDTLETPKPAWRSRKERYLSHLDQQPGSVLLVSVADKVSNARTMLRDYRLCGEELWSRFNCGRDDQLWWQRSLADAFLRLIPESRLAEELAGAVSELERAVFGPSSSR